jgi:hypothetical protein
MRIMVKALTARKGKHVFQQNKIRGLFLKYKDNITMEHKKHIVYIINFFFVAAKCKYFARS